MKEQRGIIRQKLIASLIIVALILSSYGTFLSEVVAIAINYENQRTATSDRKVSFDAYFLIGDTKSHNVVANTRDENELSLDIRLEEGVMENTKITFNNPNFQIDFEKLKENSIVKGVNETENSIELNQIMESTVIPVNISYKAGDEISLDEIKRNTEISLSSIYTNTEDTDKEINGSISVNVGWTSTIEGNIESNINNYSEISGKSVLITNYKSTMNNVTLPMKYTNFELTVPEIEDKIPDDVKIIEGGQELAEDQYTYNLENKRINITKTNSENEENKVRNITGNLEYTVIYIYNEEFKLDQVNCSLESNLMLKPYTLDEVSIRNYQELEKEKNNVTTDLKINTDSKISKAYLYNSNYEMPYSVNLEAQIQYIIPGSNIEFEEKGEKFTGDNVNLNASNISEYVNTTLNKEEVDNVLGNNGTLEIIDANTNKVISSINNKTNADELGNITITYDGVKRIKIVVENPEQIGTINIKSNKKIIKNHNISSDVLKYINKLNLRFDNKNIAVKNSVENNIELYDTVTKSTIEVSKTEFSTLDDNENMNIKLNLLTNSMDYDLYQNPKLSITFPSEFENITINSVGISFENGLSIKNKRVTTNKDGTKTLYIDLSGLQERYLSNNDVTANPQIVVDANVKINRTVSTREVDLTYNYNNEKAISYDDEGKQITIIKINAPYGLVMSTNVNGVEGQTHQLEEVEIQARSQAQVVHIEENIVNNYNSVVNNFEITGVIPLKDKEYTLGENDIISNYSASIDGNIEINRKDATIEYSSDNENWSTTRTDKSDLFRIKFNDSTLEQGDLITLSYNLKIPENISYSKNGYVAFIASGQSENNDVNAWSGVRLSTEDALLGDAEPICSTVADGDIRTELYVMQGNESLEEGQVVYNEQNLKYIIKLTNTTNAPINNVKVTAKNTNAVFYEWTEEQVDLEQFHYSYKENEEKGQQEFSIDTLDAGESKEIIYQVVVKKNGDSSTQATINLSADNIEQKEIKSIENKILDSRIKITINPGATPNYPDITEDQIIYMNTYVKNLTNETLRNIEVKLLHTENITMDDDTVLYLFDDDRVKDIEKGEKYTSLVITELQPGEEFYIDIKAKVLNPSQNELSFDTSAIIQVGDEQYYSGLLNYKVKKYFSDVSIVQTSNIDGAVKNGDKLIYNCVIQNTGAYDMDIEVDDVLPENAILKRVYYTKNNEQNEVELVNIDNSFNIDTTLAINESITIVIETEINEFIANNKSIENTVYVTSERLRDNRKASNTIENVIDGTFGSAEPEEPEPEEPEPEEPETGEPEAQEPEPQEPEPQEPEEPEAEEPEPQEPEPEEPETEEPETQEPETQEPEPEEPETEEPETQEPETQEPEITKPEESTYKIIGEIWMDENKNGIKDGSEERLGNISVRLINENGVILKKTTSNSKGKYEFTNVPKGNYRILVDCDMSVYNVTTYQKDGVGASVNSDFIKSNVIENGQSKEVPATEIINVSDKSIDNIDAGFITIEKHEIIISKTLSQVTVKTNKRTKTYDMQGKQIGKVEIASKEMPGAEVTIEYNIIIQNNGDADEYISQIIDTPSEGELENKNEWIEQNGKLVNNSLSEEKIKAGETKVFKLAIKTTVDSQGTAKTVNNKVEINQTSNDNTNVNDSKSTSQLLIGIKTGGIYITISIILSLIALIGIAVIIKKKGVK